MKNFTRISVLLVALVISGTAFAQIPYKLTNESMNLNYNKLMDLKKGTKSSRDIFSLYVDYGIANGDDLGYIWSFNSLYTGSDTALNYVGVSIDQIAGYTDPSDPDNSVVIFSNVGLPDAYPNSLVLNIDSVFVFCTHENNSGQDDQIVLKIVSTNTNGSPSTNVLNQYTKSTANSLSPSGNWLGQNALNVLEFNPAYTTAAGAKIALVFEYIDPTKVDSFGILATCVNDGQGGTAVQSAYKNSYMRYPPFINSISANANIGYGNPVGSQGWFEAQNWAITTKVTYDWNVGINDVNNNLALVSLSPNPANNLLNVKVSLNNTSNVVAQLTDVTGRVVSSLYNGVMTAGNNAVSINTSDLAAGIYFINVKANDGNMVSTRFVIAR